MDAKNANQGLGEIGSKQAPGSPSVTPKRPPIVQARVDSRADNSSPVFSFLSHNSPVTSTLPPSVESPALSVKERPPLPPRSDSALKPSPMITDRDDIGTLARLATQLSSVGEEPDRIQSQHPLALLKDQVGEFLQMGTGLKRIGIPVRDQRPSLWKYIKGKGTFV